MGDSVLTDLEPNKFNSASNETPEKERRPFGGLEFQVSEVVGRLEAGVNAQEPIEEDKKKEMRKISTGFFDPEETAMDDILKVLEDLVIKTDPSCESIEPPLLPTDAVTRAAILSHSISALFGRLERSHAARLGAHIASETTRWMAHMFRLSDYNAFYHQEHLEGLVRVTKMLLHHKYPRYLEDGALAFTSRLPCIYSCVASPLGIVQHLCRQLGLPLACVRPVPVNNSGNGMDIDALDRLCDEDINANRIPLLVLGEAGAPPLGSGSSLKSLAEVCKQRAVHLHVRGHSVALVAVLNREETFDIADSVTLCPGPWFGVPGLPTVTFYRLPEPIPVNDISKGANTTSNREATLPALAGLTSGGARLPALPLWTALRCGGGKRLAARISKAFRSARAAHAVVESADLTILSEKPGGDEPLHVDLIDAISNASACLAFQLRPSASARPPPYYDKLNQWLGQVLQREPDMISIEVCETESFGVVLRYCPLEGTLLDDDKVDCFAAVLDAQLQVLRATIALKEPFQKKILEYPTLRHVNLPGWAGLGGVRYVPQGWEEASSEDLDSLNKQLVSTLRATDSAFSCGDGEDGISCVRFGMVTADSDLEELLELLLAAAKEVEDNYHALSNMTEVVKKGIEAAQADMERESANQLWQQGMLRMVPVVGRVVQWWSPAEPRPGRRLHLAHGTLQTTNDLYKLVQSKKEDEHARAHSPSRQQQPDDAN